MNKMATNIVNVLIMNVLTNKDPKESKVDTKLLVSAVEALANSTAEAFKKAVVKDNVPPVALEDKEVIEIMMMEPSHPVVNGTFQDVISR